MNVYDFDNTIYDGESVLDFFLYRLRYEPRLLRLLPFVLKTWIQYKRCKIDLEEITLRVEKYILTFLKDAETLDRMVKDFWDRKQHKIKDLYLRMQRPDDIIISASCDFLLKEICQRVGIKTCISSEIDLETGKIKFICYRKNKVQIFKERYPDAEIDAFYTDSMNDLPMIQLAKRAYLVKGNRIKRLEV